MRIKTRGKEGREKIAYDGCFHFTVGPADALIALLHSSPRCLSWPPFRQQLAPTTLGNRHKLCCRDGITKTAAPIHRHRRRCRHVHTCALPDSERAQIYSAGSTSALLLFTLVLRFCYCYGWHLSSVHQWRAPYSPSVLKITGKWRAHLDFLFRWVDLLCNWLCSAVAQQRLWQFSSAPAEPLILCIIARAGYMKRR